MKHGVQLFGGLGYTWENDIQLYLKRAKAGELLFGTTKDHRAKAGRTVMEASLAAAGREPSPIAHANSSAAKGRRQDMCKLA
jgi:hypothetical protein